MGHMGLWSGWEWHSLVVSTYLLGFGRVGRCGLARQCAQRLALWLPSRGRCPLPVQQQNHSVINRKAAHQ